VLDVDGRHTSIKQHTTHLRGRESVLAVESERVRQAVPATAAPSSGSRLSCTVIGITARQRKNLSPCSPPSEATL